MSRRRFWSVGGFIWRPLPLIAAFHFANGAQGFVSTRIKMGATSSVRAVVKAGGKTYTAAKEVKVTIGGCGG